ncbi:MAG TPA: sigma-70 family RNA polymerase sigma factor [Candidatus Acidoferrales bacterium]|nr:sigma-70 family RNA polymerase sigma factor [Candidatus Acidoferrales bacterium]
MGIMGMSAALDAAAGTAQASRQRAVQRAEEQVLVRQAQAGNRPAFEELVRRYDRDVLRLAMNLVRGSEDARDLYQEVFLRAYRNLSRFRFECSFYTWIYRIATNVCLDHLRRKNTRKEEQAPQNADGETAPDFFDQQMEQRAAANPELNLLGQELGRHIDAALDGLSPRERMVFELKHYEGLRLRAIGDMLGTSEETVKNSLFRATRKMRASLGGMR